MTALSRVTLASAGLSCSIMLPRVKMLPACVSAAGRPVSSVSSTVTTDQRCSHSAEQAACNACVLLTLPPAAAAAATAATTAGSDDIFTDAPYIVQ